MNYKLLFPTYRNRYRFIQQSLKRMADKKKYEKALNLGTGEGDYDQMIAGHCHLLKSCDINEQDIAFAKVLNVGVPNIEYAVENALALSYPSDHFDLLISVDVIEHVGQPEQMVKELSRVLKPGGLAMITFPSLDYPFTYDPVNRVLSAFSDKHIPQGAYAFGHEYLISRKDFRLWADTYGLEVVFERNLSGYLVGLLEMYWTGIIQRIFKANATNISKQEAKKVSLRPSNAEPLLARLTDGINRIDHILFGKASHSVGKGFILRKANSSI